MMVYETHTGQYIHHTSNVASNIKVSVIQFSNLGYDVE